MSKRPNIENLAYLLGVYSNSTIPQTYLNEMSNYELLLTVVNKVNEIIERCVTYDTTINEVINYLNTLDDEVIDYLEKLKDSGFFATEIEKILRKARKILIVGDSYTAGQGVNANETYVYLLQQMGYDVTAIHSSGGGFIANGVNGNFLNVLTNYVESHIDDLIKFTDVWFLGGVNDSFSPENDVIMYLNNTIAYAKSKFINAKIQIGYISQLHREQCNLDGCIKTREIYKSQNSDYGYISNIEYVLKQLDALQDDGTHPNAKGHRLIANALKSFINDNNISVQHYQTISFSKTEDSQISDGYVVDWRMNQHNGNISIISRSQTIFNIADAVVVTNPDTNAVVLGYLNNGLIWGQSDYSGAFSDVNIPVQMEIRYEGGINSFPAVLQIYQNKLLIRFLSLASATSYNQLTIQQINIPPFNVNVNADYC